jgi:hypothetical protein
MTALVIAVEQQNLWINVVIDRDPDLDYSVSNDFWSACKVDVVLSSISIESSVDDSHSLEMSWK